MPFRRLLFGLLLLACGMAAAAQGTVPVVMLSDIHFDPFHDPHVLAQLRSRPIEQWPAILNTRPTLTEDADRAALQLECHSRGVDTPWALLRTSLVAAHQAEAHPVFVTLSGDLLAHQFPCRFRRLAPTANPQELSDFSAKTVAFVVRQLRLAFPHVPVYVALGNNDSGCADYHETADSSFLQSFAGTSAAAAVPGRARGRLRAEVSPEGDYSVTLPRPFLRGRLIVLDDVFDSRQFGTCGGPADGTPQAAQLQWLHEQLARAQARHEQVWVMGHIPPGIDVYTSFYRYLLRPGDLCNATPHGFLQDTALTDTLLQYADVIRLALFAHTHMDEIRLLHRAAAPAGTGAEAVAEAIIPVKLVPSITPYFGNHPAFLVAYVDPHTLVLKDWETVVSPGPEGSTPPWTVAYHFDTAYHLPDFSAASAQRLADGFAADRGGRSAASKTYRGHFFAGDVGLYALGLDQIWPAYACSVREDHMDAFRGCLCPAK